MNIGEANRKLTMLKDQYANNQNAKDEIDRVLSELNTIKKLPVSEEEKRRKVAQLAQIETKLAQNDKFKKSAQGIALEGAKTVASVTGTVLGLIVNILFAAAQGSGNPGRIHVATHMGPNPARIGGTKKRCMTKKR